jgi:dihydrodipicolinate synthase/N-acetylneuraminate lyase
VNRESVDWKGYMPATTTPFTEEGALDRAGWLELLEWLVSEGMHGLVIAGSSGEWFSLTPEERVELFRSAVEQVGGRIPVIGCCNAISPRESLEYALAAEEIGMDGIILAPPPYSRPNERELVAFYQTLAARVRLPLCLYNWPRGTGIDMSTALVARLAEIDTVVAIKNSTATLTSFLETFFALKDEIRIFGFGTDELSITLLVHHGGDGTIGGGAVLGCDHPDFFNHLWAGDLDAARRCGARDKLFFDFSMNPDFSPKLASAQAVMKAALNLRGLPGGYPRPPYLPLTEQELELVRRTLAELDLLSTTAPAGSSTRAGAR